MKMETCELTQWLQERDPRRLEDLWSRADRQREDHVGNQVHLRGLLEISNHCGRSCWYCGLRKERTSLTRYRMSKEEIMDCVLQAQRFGYGTVVIQAGEDQGLEVSFISKLVEKIKSETTLAVTLSLGEQPQEVYRTWREAGADRYLLRIETTNEELLNRIHPGQPFGQRKDHLKTLKQLGYEVGSGIMVGIPGQTYAMVVNDLLWFQSFDLDMIGIGPYLSHPQTPLAMIGHPSLPDQTENSELLTNIVVALARLVCPQSNIPATTALATVNKAQGRELALNHGANVVMPNLTPAAFRAHYDIYPNKACIDETAEICHSCIKNRILSLGRSLGKGPGSRIRNAFST